MPYNWQQLDWPEFRFETSALAGGLLEIARYAGRVGGLLAGLPEDVESEAVIDLMISEAVTSFAIEGEVLREDEVKSSIRNHLGLNRPSEFVRDRRAEGMGELMVAARTDWRAPLSAGMLSDWHAMLWKGERRLRVGSWRTDGGPMQVVSGRVDRPTVHFEALSAARVPAEMNAFLSWFNRTAPGESEAILHAPVRAGIAHLYFESIHPFEDGNGRIGRAISEKALAQGLGAPALLSLSQTIEAHRADYYDALNKAQQSMEITPWLEWFVGKVALAQSDAEARIAFVLRKSKFFERFREALNARQLKLIRRMLEAGPAGFEGGMNARKYVALTKTSKATATRDLQHLAGINALRSVGAGRSTRYELNL